MAHLIPHHPLTDPSWTIQGDRALLVEAARELRLRIDRGVHRPHPPGEYAMFGVARLLDAIAFSVHVDGAVHHTVVPRGTEIAHHVLDHLLRTPRTDAARV